ncbi:RNA polymerase factor sigma-54 [Aeribacillus sp. FSL K6-8394]|uniref:RNA polymerase factor sigma-54 n=1 Tax=Aeribacillus sp. FSL K6-8394 TaxID=2954570 RepID=UPI0030F72C7A
MHIKMDLVQNQSLRLAMTKELKQAIGLLQYSTIDLVSYLREITLENPFVELEESHPPIFYHNQRKQQRASKEDGRWIENMPKKGMGLKDHLRNQLVEFRFTENERRAIHILIDAVDSNGYMSEDLSRLSEKFQISIDLFEKQLSVLQSLDPIGVGARSLQECLLLQAKEIEEKPEGSEFVLKEHFHLFATKAWKDLSKKTGLSLNALQQIFDFVQTLNPRPGLQFDEETPNYIIPDLMIEERNGDWIVYYNEDLLPQIKINRDYEPIVQTEKEVKSYVQTKLHQGRWLLKSLEQRKETLVKVMQEIIRFQKDFFYLKNNILKPLTLKDIANSLNIHESTVSRAVNDKFVQTPFGLYELKYFFTNKVGEEDTSSANVKQVIQQLIDQENKQRPLSDQKIANLLKENYNMNVSRRTVAKYRDQLNIPSSNLRKRYN